MKLKEYLENLNKLAKDNPEYLEFEVISSIDDEGNGFNRIHFEPTLGIYDIEDREFISLSNIEEWERDKSELNAVCIN